MEQFEPLKREAAKIIQEDQETAVLLDSIISATGKYLEENGGPDNDEARCALLSVDVRDAEVLSGEDLTLIESLPANLRLEVLKSAQTVAIVRRGGGKNYDGVWKDFVSSTLH